MLGSTSVPAIVALIPSLSLPLFTEYPNLPSTNSVFCSIIRAPKSELSCSYPDAASVESTVENA